MPHPLYALPSVRDRRHLTVEALAEGAGVTVPTVRRLERGGVPTYMTWRQVAHVLGVDPGDLLHVSTAADCPECLAYLRRVWPLIEAETIDRWKRGQ